MTWPILWRFNSLFSDKMIKCLLLQDDGIFLNRSKTSGGKDYSIGIEQGDHRVSKEELSNNPEDVKWDHFREETLLHVFHTLLHKVFDASVKSGVPRVFELFFYTHQQLMRRANLERAVAGLKEITPLDPRAIRQSLGPGYRAGW